MDYFAQVAFLSLVIQIVTLSTVVSGYILKRRKKLIEHGTLMAVATAIQFASFLLIMGPALLSLAENGLAQRPELFAVTIVHSGLGSTTLATGIWITGSWHFKSSMASCVKRKSIMRYLFAIWILALVFGVALYLMLYVLT